MRSEKWTVEKLARYLWERAKVDTCEGCKVQPECDKTWGYDCGDLDIILKEFGIKEDT